MEARVCAYCKGNILTPITNESYKCKKCGSINYDVDKEINIKLANAQTELSTYNFTRADDIYKNILDNTTNPKVEAMALKGRICAYFGIVYVKGFYDDEVVATFANYDEYKVSIKSTPYYRDLLECEISEQDKQAYIDELNKLDEEYQKIKYELDKTPEYDVFICTKISTKTKEEPNARGFTEDYEIAQDFYDALEEKGLNVFLSKKSLKGVEYDGQIFSALMRSKVILIISTCKEYLESCWVESEWRRWLNFIDVGKRGRDTLYLYLDDKNVSLPSVLLSKKIQKFYSNQQIELLGKIYDFTKKDEIERERIEKENSIRKQAEADSLAELEKRNKQLEDMQKTIFELQKEKGVNSDNDQATRDLFAKMQQKIDELDSQLKENSRKSQSNNNDSLNEMQSKIDALEKKLSESSKNDSNLSSIHDYDVILYKPGDAKLSIIKEVRDLFNLSLKEAKELVDNTPVSLCKTSSNDEALNIKKRLEALGAIIKIEDNNISDTHLNNPIEYYDASRYEVELSSAGKDKLSVIKKSRELLNVGLKEAKELVDQAPTIILVTNSKDKALNVKNELEILGADIRIKGLPDNVLKNENTSVKNTTPSTISTSAINTNAIKSDSPAKEHKISVYVRNRKIATDVSISEAIYLKNYYVSEGADVIFEYDDSRKVAFPTKHLEKENSIILLTQGEDKLKTISLIQNQFKLNYFSAKKIVESVPIVLMTKATEPEGIRIIEAIEKIQADAAFGYFISDTSSNNQYINSSNQSKNIDIGFKNNSSIQNESAKTNYSTGLNYKLNDDGQSYSVVGIGTCNDKQLVIPDRYIGKKITEIGYNAFKDCTKLESIIIPNTVTKIAAFAFSGCDNLRRIAIPDSVTEIGLYAFEKCGKLLRVSLPDSVRKISDGMFAYCISLQQITFSKKLDYIGAFAFHNCRELQSIIIPISVLKIGNFAFDGCKKISIYSENSSKGINWANNWITGNKSVKWGFKE